MDNSFIFHFPQYWILRPYVSLEEAKIPTCRGSDCCVLNVVIE